MKPVILGVTTLLLAKQTRHLERLVRDDDDFRLKGWMGATETTFGREWDKGHFIAHSIGGAVDCAEVNVFVQLRAPNRGWSEAGKRFREMEAYCEANSERFVSTARLMTIKQRARPS